MLLKKTLYNVVPFIAEHLPKLNQNVNNLGNVNTT